MVLENRFFFLNICFPYTISNFDPDKRNMQKSYLSDMIELGTGSRSTFEFTSRVNLFGPSLYSIARTFG